MIDERRKKNSFRVQLTAEGWAFVVILGFVAVSAILRNVNLLVVLAGMMISTLLLSWRAQVHILKSLVARRIVPVHVHAGELVSLQWECHNKSNKLAAWNVKIKDRMQRTDSEASSTEDQSPRGPKKKGKKNAISAMIHFPEVLSQQSMFASYKTMFANRGTYDVGTAEVSTNFPFALMKSTKKLATLQAVVVAPRLGTLSATWDRRLQAIAAGDEATKRRRGSDEDEYYALRRWRPGDNHRHIHWRTTAKQGHPMIKQFDQKSDRDLAMVLDLYAPTESSKTEFEFTVFDDWSQRCETALSFAATVFTKLNNAVQGQVAFGICGQSTDVLVDRYHGELISHVMRALALARATPDSNLGPTIMALADSVSIGTPVYVISSREMPSNLSSWGIPDSDFNRIQGSIRWLRVGSTEFDLLFRDTSEAETKRVRTIHQTWMSDVSG